VPARHRRLAACWPAQKAFAGLRVAPAGKSGSAFVTGRLAQRRHIRGTLIAVRRTLNLQAALYEMSPCCPCSGSTLVLPEQDMTVSDTWPQGCGAVHRLSGMGFWRAGGYVVFWLGMRHTILCHSSAATSELTF